MSLQSAEKYIDQSHQKHIKEKDMSAFIPAGILHRALDGRSKGGITMLEWKPISITPGMNIVQKHDALIR